MTAMIVEAMRRSNGIGDFVYEVPTQRIECDDNCPNQMAVVRRENIQYNPDSIVMSVRNISRIPILLEYCARKSEYARWFSGKGAPTL